MANDCIFCKIIAKEFPAYIVYEDEEVVAFLDKTPTSLGHTLVVPKKHTEDISSTDVETLTCIMSVVKKIGAAQKTQLSSDGFNVMQNNGAAAGQVIFHIHWHVIPRKIGDGLRHWPGREYKDGEAEKTQICIKNGL